MTAADIARLDVTQANWLVEFRGPGFRLAEEHDSEASAYTAARAAAANAAAAEPVIITLRFNWGRARRDDVYGIGVQRLDGEGEWRNHSRSWSRIEPHPDALTVLPEDYWMSAAELAAHDVEATS